MDVTVIQKINKEYYREYYLEWLRFQSKYRKWEHVIGFASLLIAVIVYLVNHSFFYIALGLLFFGITMIYQFYSSKQKWLNIRQKNKANNSQIKFVFKNDQVEIYGALSESVAHYSAFDAALETEKGLMLIPQNGISFYLQKKIFNNVQDIETIIKKIEEQK